MTRFYPGVGLRGLRQQPFRDHLNPGGIRYAMTSGRPFLATITREAVVAASHFCVRGERFMGEVSVLNSIGRRVRVNHAVEHATITILSGRLTDVVLRGRSNRNGFWVAGDVSASAIEDAATEALQRLRAGQSELAIHPFCGTNLAVGGLLAWTASLAAVKMARKGESLPASILAALIGLAVSQPLGIWVQRYLTTSADVGGLRIESVREKRLLGRRLHFVRTVQ